MVMITVGGANAVTALLTAKEVLLFHERSDAFAAVIEAGFAQLVGDTRAAVGFAA